MFDKKPAYILPFFHWCKNLLFTQKNGEYSSRKVLFLIGFLAERAALRELGTATGGGAEDGVAGAAKDDGVSVGEDSGDTHAAGALDVHEVGVGGLDKAFLLVGSLLLSDGGVEEVVLDKRHFWCCT